MKIASRTIVIASNYDSHMLYGKDISQIREYWIYRNKDRAIWWSDFKGYGYGRNDENKIEKNKTQYI